jgi:hypothetical protein
LDIKNIEDAKRYAQIKLIQSLNLDQTYRQLEVFRDLLRNSNDQNTKELCQQKIISLENWLENEDFKAGNFPHGINELMLELIEWRALIFAFQNTETEKSPFKDHVFYAQWLVGGTYAVFAILGKLVNNDNRENSLINLWKKILEFIEQDGFILKDELTYINNGINNKNGFFHHDNSKAIEFRNTVIAHNQKSLTMQWDEIDKDIEILVRIWSLIVSWSSHRPDLSLRFRTPEHAFSGTENFFTVSEMARLKAKRREYISRVILWSRTHLHNSEIDPESGIFFTLS